MVFCFEAFFGGINADGLLFSICVFSIIHFIHSYYKYCYKKGYKIDFWHFNIFLHFILPIHIMYPFAGSDFNIFSTGGSLILIQDFVPKAYILSTIGYLFTYIGFYFYDYGFLGVNLRGKVNSISWIGEKLIITTLKDKFIMILFSMIIILASIICIIYAIYNFGLSFNLRGAFYSEDSLLKSFFNLWTALFTNISGLILIRYLYKKELIFLLVYIFISFFALFSGARSTLLFPFINSIIFYLIARKNKLKIKNVFFLGFVFLFLVFFLDRLRMKDTTNSLSVLYSILYGNSFSDLRDFAWILAYWDENILLGKSYLSAFISFVPRSISDFRSAYAFGVYTDLMIGFDPLLHPGLRPGRFGEVYLNFGVYGIIILGFIGGYIYRYADIKIKKYIEDDHTNYIYMYSGSFLPFFISQFYITAGFWSFYVFILILILSSILKMFFNILEKRRV